MSVHARGVVNSNLFLWYFKREAVGGGALAGKKTKIKTEMYER